MTYPRLIRKEFVKVSAMAWVLLAVLSYGAYAEVAFLGRDFDTYKRMFCIEDDEKELKDKRILDAPAGPSTFLGTLKDKGWLQPGSKAVDRAYTTQREINDLRAIEDLMAQGMKQSFTSFYDGSYKNWPEEDQERFLTKYKHFNSVHSTFLDYYQKFPTLYVQGDVRDLSKIVGENEKFDLVFSSNLLFLYSEQDLNEDFHRDAILSMAQTVKEKREIRIFPLDNFKALPPPFFNHLLEELHKHRLKTEIRDGCAPSVGQYLKGRVHDKGQMLVIKWDSK